MFFDFDIFVFPKNSITMQSVFCKKSLYKLTTFVKLRFKRWISKKSSVFNQIKYSRYTGIN